MKIEIELNETIMNRLERYRSINIEALQILLSNTDKEDREGRKEFLNGQIEKYKNYNYQELATMQLMR